MPSYGAQLGLVEDAGSAQRYAGDIDSYLPGYLAAKNNIEGWMFPAGSISAADLNTVMSNVGRMSQEIDSKVTKLLNGTLAPTVSLFFSNQLSAR